MLIRGRCLQTNNGEEFYCMISSCNVCTPVANNINVDILFILCLIASILMIPHLFDLMISLSIFLPTCKFMTMMKQEAWCQVHNQQLSSLMLHATYAPHSAIKQQFSWPVAASAFGFWSGRIGGVDLVVWYVGCVLLWLESRRMTYRFCELRADFNTWSWVTLLSLLLLLLLFKCAYSTLVLSDLYVVVVRESSPGH